MATHNQKKLAETRIYEVLNFFAFRLNKGNVKNHTFKCMEAIAGAMGNKRITCKELTSG